MIENENTAIVRRWFEELWNQRRLETINELLAPDAISYDLAGPTRRSADATPFAPLRRHFWPRSASFILPSKRSLASKIASRSG
jgi:hypothetical protein